MMMKYAKILPASAIFIILSVMAGPAPARDMVNLLQNPGFEAGMPEPWKVYHTGDYKVIGNSKEAQAGNFFATFAWQKHPEGGYCALTSPQIKVYPGTTYEAGIWAKGKGKVALWIIQQSDSGHYLGNDMGSGNGEALTPEWKQYTRTWTAPEGVRNAHLFVTLADGLANYDDVFFGYDRDAFTPPETETLLVTPRVKAHDAEFTLTLNNEPLAGPRKILYGESVLGIAARATGPNPGLSGEILFGGQAIALDSRWRAAAPPTGDAWKKPGFDDRAWPPVPAGQGFWPASNATAAAFRRVVLWNTHRQEPALERQWVAMVLDRMYVAEGSAGAFVTRMPFQNQLAAEELTLHIEAPAFLKLLERDAEAVHGYSNYRHRRLETREFERAGAKYTHYAFTYALPAPGNLAYYAPLYFRADDHIPRDEKYLWFWRRAKKYDFTFWREANGNITDLPVVLPVTVTGPVNGRQCRYFDLTYNRPPITHSGGLMTYSLAERRALTETLVQAGMNTAWADDSLTEKWGVLDYFRTLQNRNVKLAWGFNFGMNWPGSQPTNHPDLQAKFYAGDKETFERNLGHRWLDMAGKAMWCQEYVAAGGKEFFDALRPKIQEAKDKLGDIYYVFWDWEYETFAYSCFCGRCQDAFRKFAKIPADVELTDQIIVAKYPKPWMEFRLDQCARHLLQMQAFCREYGTKVTNWHPGSSLKETDFDYNLLGKAYSYHFMGCPGSMLPLMGMGRGGNFVKCWKELNPGIHVVGQTIVDYFHGTLIDERLFKVWTITMALMTDGGGWVLWLDSTYPFNQTHGQSYFMGEATRLIAAHEEFFKKGRHIEDQFTQTGLSGKGNELIALEGPDGKEALVLLFNEGAKPATVKVTAKDAAAGWTSAQQWEGPAFSPAARLVVEVPARDVVALRYRQK